MSLSQSTMKMPWGDELPISAYCPNDPYLQLVIAEIYRKDGVRALFKGKNLRKFGKTTNADSGVKTTIATFGSVATVNVNETFVTTNLIDEVCSSSADDTEILCVEGHSIDVLGNLTFVTQTVTLTGQTPVELTTPLARCNRMFVEDGTFASPSADLVGDIYAYDSSGTTVTAGVPQTSAAVKLRIVAGANQTEKCATSISGVDYWYIRQLEVGINRSAANTVTADCDIECRAVGGVFRPAGLEMQLRTSGTQSDLRNLAPGIIVSSSCDVRAVVTTNAADVTVSGYMSGPLLTTDWSYEDGIITINS